ncbi:rhomboid family intramembrane serine protease [Planctomycetes bacterium K23_9]|uniref:Rhomboid family protein n=1 Tax=Stieleria marina TaxID=1930275 RepID=A0A517P0X1_9BACT|nr:Rhomboid family protein [Planctomycetes bacterium K23_9]
MRSPFYFVAAFVLSIWLVFLVDWPIPYDLSQWGIHPRRLTGIPGIALMPFLHGSFYHLFSNSIPLAILLVLLVGSQRKPWQVVTGIVLLNGALVWLMARSDTNHVGASGLVFGLIGFLILNGFLEKKVVSIIVALVVGFFFGSTLISGMIPQIGGEVSWEAHFFGAVSGAVVAYAWSQMNQRLAWK